MQKTAEEYQKDLLWQTALETFYRIAYAESLMTSVLQIMNRRDHCPSSVLARN